MQTNTDYDLAKPLATAIRAKAPYVGVPISGHAPLVFNRAKLCRALKGVKPLDVSIQAVEGSKVRLLVVEGIAGPRVRTKLRMAALPVHWWKTYEGRTALGSWRDAEMKARDKSAVRCKPTKGFNHAVATVKRLQRELDKMGHEYSLPNPCLRGRYEYQWTAESRAHTEADWLDYRRTKRMRTLVGALSRTASRKNWSSRELYAAMTQRGWEFTRYSDVRQPAKERYAHGYFDYVRNLWRFVRGTGSQSFLQMRRYNQPEWMREAMRRIVDPSGEPNDLGWGSARYYVKLEDMRQRQSLRAQIEAITAEVPGVRQHVTVNKLERELRQALRLRWSARGVDTIQAELNAARKEAA